MIAWSSQKNTHVENCLLLLGTNLGKREENLQKAIELLEKQVGKLTKLSAIYETEPWGVSNQPNYLNQIVEIETALSPQKLLEQTQKIEKTLGRFRREKWEARPIDIDILYFGQQIINLPKLIVPHPFLQERRFTLIPLVAIVPDFIHPVLKKNQQELLEICLDEGIVNKFEF